MTLNRRLLVIAVVVLTVAAGLAAFRWWADDPGRVQEAVALAPEESQRLTWTDWAAVRDELGANLSGGSPLSDVDDFLDDGFTADLTSTSTLVRSAATLHQEYGVSPATLDWELLAQTTEGHVIILGLPDELDLDELRATLESLGYTESEDAEDRWQIHIDELVRVGELTPEFVNLQLDEDERVLVASEDPAFLAQWSETQRGEDVDDGLGDVVPELRAPVSAVLYSGDHVCGALSMGQADTTDIRQGNQLLSDAGEVHPIRGYAMVALPGGSAEVLMAFETDEHARNDADTRAVLASGPAPGQGGTFADRFTLGEVSADGRVVRMEMEPTPGAYLLSDLSEGPVLFATC